jgi:surfeit locus 1 family protein
MSTTPAPRSAVARALLVACAIVAFAGFIALGTWQLQRRTWKLDLIDRVEHRVHAPPVAAPAPGEWPNFAAAPAAADYEYRRIRVTGRFLHERETLVAAATELGSGYWVITPLQQADGSTVLVNRGFVPPERRARTTRPAGSVPGEVTVTGLLRLSEPRGTLLRRNDPAAERWYSRDVQAIGVARGLDAVAPYFIDAEAPATGEDMAAGAPVGGLTVTTFRNNHLQYALTWYALALMVVIGLRAVLRAERSPETAAHR